MAKSKTKKIAKKVSPKKQAQIDAIQKLNSAFADLKESIGEKKFEARIKKAAKLLTDGVKKVKPVKKKKAVKATSAAETAA
jgi:predicted transcriptional regulator